MSGSRRLRPPMNDWRTQYTRQLNVVDSAWCIMPLHSYTRSFYSAVFCSSPSVSSDVSSAVVLFVLQQLAMMMMSTRTAAGLNSSTPCIIQLPDICTTPQARAGERLSESIYLIKCSSLKSCSCSAQLGCSLYLHVSSYHAQPHSLP